MNYCFRFPVVKGVQAGHTYFIAMVPLKMINKLFQTDEEYVLPEYRAQRRLNENRIPEITKYILDNRNSYVFSALAASIDGKFVFIPIGEGDVGILEVDMDAKFLINDGQHRKAAIVAALEIDPELGEETISVVLFEDNGLTRSQQMFTDLNKHAVKTSNSIAELYDSRDQLAVITRSIIADIPFLNEFVDKERDNLGKFSSALFTLNTFYTANKKILRRKTCDERFAEFVKLYWSAVTNNMEPWKDMVNKEISKKELREQYIATQAVVIQAFGRVGAFFYDNTNYPIDDYIDSIRNINWKRNAEEWRLRVIRSNGRMINNADAIILTANVIKKYMNLPLSDDEQTAEEKFLINIR